MKIIECPRDAMQGIHDFIPTDQKIEYLNSLLQVGFDTLDFGSFVSPKAIPQMQDTHEVLAGLNLHSSNTALLAIIANIRGAEAALEFDEIDYLGYPLSLSETFQQRNTNRSIGQAFDDLAEIQEMCDSEDKQLVTYLSMGFGNPYGDPYQPDYLRDFIAKLDQLGVSVISLADTVGQATDVLVEEVFTRLIPSFPHIEIGAHLHARPAEVRSRVRAAYQGGCRRIDGALKGFGGCPMAGDQLVGNLATESIISELEDLGVALSINKDLLSQSLDNATRLFSSFV